MSIARIQFLHKTDLGWHIRFTASDDSFWTVVEHFKTEQRNSQKINCHWNPRLFDGKGGWFVTDRILLKYQDYFENYQHMRKAAEVDYELEHQEDLWGETKAEREEQKEETRRKEQEQSRARWDQAKERQKQQWDQWDKEQQQEHRKGDWHSSFNRSDSTYSWEASWTFDKKQEQEEAAKQRKREQQSRPPVRPTSTGLTLSEALIELGFSALAHPTEIEVKKAFRQLAMKKHPDHGGTHEAMIKLNKAYQMVLWSVQGVKA